MAKPLFPAHWSCMGCTWKEQMSWAQFLGGAIIRSRTHFGFPAKRVIHELLFFCIKLIWCPSQTAWMPLFLRCHWKVPVTWPNFFGWKNKSFCHSFVDWKTVLEVHLQQQDFRQLCTVEVNMQSRGLSSVSTKYPKNTRSRAKDSL